MLLFAFLGHAGWHCPPASVDSRQIACGGEDRFCPQGSGTPQQVPAHHCNLSFTRTIYSNSSDLHVSLLLLLEGSSRILHEHGSGSLPTRYLQGAAPERRYRCLAHTWFSRRGRMPALPSRHVQAARRRHGGVLRMWTQGQEHPGQTHVRMLSICHGTNPFPTALRRLDIGMFQCIGGQAARQFPRAGHAGDEISGTALRKRILLPGRDKAQVPGRKIRRQRFGDKRGV